MADGPRPPWFSDVFTQLLSDLALAFLQARRERRDDFDVDYRIGHT